MGDDQIEGTAELWGLHALSFCGYTIFVGIATWVLVRRIKSRSDVGEAADHFAGGRALPWPVVAGSLMLTNISTEQLVGLNGMVFRDGCQAGSAYEIFAAIAMCITAIFFLPRFLKSGFTTSTGFLGERFDLTTRSLASGIFLTYYTLCLCPAVLYTGATALRTIFDLDMIPFWAISLGIGLLGSIYALCGGLKAVAVSDCLNGIGLIAAGLWVPIAGIMNLGGLETLFSSPEYFRTLTEHSQVLDCPDEIIKIEAEESINIEEIGNFVDDPACHRVDGIVTVPWHVNLTGMILCNLYYWSTNQVILQRALGAKSLAHAQKGVFCASFLKVLGWTMLCTYIYIYNFNFDF